MPTALQWISGCWERSAAGSSGLSRLSRLELGMSPLERLVKAMAFSWAGLCAAFRYQQVFRREVAILIFAIFVGLWLGRDAVERALLVSSWLLVMVVELINSAIEAVVEGVAFGSAE